MWNPDSSSGSRPRRLPGLSLGASLTVASVLGSVLWWAVSALWGPPDHPSGAAGAGPAVGDRIRLVPQAVVCREAGGLLQVGQYRLSPGSVPAGDWAELLKAYSCETAPTNAAYTVVASDEFSVRLKRADRSPAEVRFADPGDVAGKVAGP